VVREAGKSRSETQYHDSQDRAKREGALERIASYNQELITYDTGKASGLHRKTLNGGSVVLCILVLETSMSHRMSTGGGLFTELRVNRQSNKKTLRGGVKHACKRIT